MKYILKAHTIWQLGARKNQEDALYPANDKIKDSDRLFILCDGMGGYEQGEVASNVVCESISESILKNCPDSEGQFTNEMFEKALTYAYDELDKHDNGEEQKMGTTMTFLKFHNQGCTIAHIGDSRVYHIRPGVDSKDTTILFQTEDHSLINEWIRQGEMTYEEARNSKQKNVITKAMQAGMEYRPKADLHFSYDIKPGDYFFMCSDGMLEQMEEDNLKYIFSHKIEDDAKRVQMLTQVTQENLDNHSAIIIHILDVIDPIPTERTEEIPVMNTLKGITDFKIPSEEENIEVEESDELDNSENIVEEETESDNALNSKKQSVEVLNDEILQAGKTQGIWMRFVLYAFALLCVLGIAYSIFSFFGAAN